MVGFGKSRNTGYRPRPPRAPVNLAFGVLKPKDANPSPEAVQAPAPEPLPMRHEIVGTLTLKNVRTSEAPPLPEKLLERIEKNLKAVYEEGKFGSSRMIIDYKNDEMLVSFPFNQAAVERIKGLDKNERAWDPDEKCWRIFIGCFDDVLDILGRGTKLTEAAYEAIKKFIRTDYYAYIAKGKFGKLVLREAWFEELELGGERVTATPFSNAAEAGETPTIPEGVDLGELQGWVDHWSFERKPFQHQLKGIEYLLVNREAALLDEMGCGKSFQIASAIAILLAHQQIDRVLVVAPMSLLRTWQDELRIANVHDFQVVSGTPKQRQKAMASKARVFIVHYEGLRLESEQFAEWLKQGKGMLVFDESQRIKNLAAQTTQAAQRLRPHCERCVIATGTPIANRPLDLFAQYLVMDKGRTFGVKFSSFKNTFCDLDVQKISVGRKKITVEKFLGIRNGAELRKRILRTSLRRLKSEVLDLPPVLYKDYVVDLKAEQKTMYQQMRDNLRVEIDGMSAEDVVKEANSIVVKLLRLAQISSNPRLLASDYEGANAKLSELDTMLEDILSDENKKVILWSHFVENVSFLVENYREKYKAVGHTGDMSIDERQASISAFRDDPETRLFIATPQSAKEGLTLLPRDGRTRADTMIYLDLSFDSASYIQSQARFHRIGQEAERCLVIHLIGEGTVDEYIRKTIAEKIQTAVQLLDDKGQPNAAVVSGSGGLTKQQIMRIL